MWVAYLRLAVLGKHDVRVCSFHSTTNNCFPRARSLAQNRRARGHKIATAPHFSLLAAHRDPAEPKLPNLLCNWVPVCFHSPRQLVTSPAKLAWMCQDENRRGSFPMWNQGKGRTKMGQRPRKTLLPTAGHLYTLPSWGFTARHRCRSQWIKEHKLMPASGLHYHIHQQVNKTPKFFANIYWLLNWTITNHLWMNVNA